MVVGSFVPGHWCRGDGALVVVNVREGRNSLRPRPHPKTYPIYTSTLPFSVTAAGGTRSAPCGPAGSLRSGNPTPAARANPARPLAPRRIRSSGSATLPCNARRLGTTALPQMNQCLNGPMQSQIANSTTNYQLPPINYQLPSTSSTLLHGHFTRRRGRRRYDTSVRGQSYQLPTTIYQLPN